MSKLQKLHPMLFAIIFLAVSVASLSFVWLRIDSDGDEVYERMQTIANEEAFETQYNELQDRMDQTASERRFLDQFVLQDENSAIELLSTVDEIALRHNIELATKQLTVIENGGDFDDLSVSFNLMGTEDSVMKMIRMFETMPYHGRITALAVGRINDKKKGTLVVEADISLLVSIKKND